MTAKLAVILTFGSALALTAQPVMASSHSGGGHSGGGHAVARSGGGHAVAHSSGGHVSGGYRGSSGGYRGGGGGYATTRGGGGRAPAYGGGVASARHPRAGGYYSYGRGGGYYGRGGGNYYYGRGGYYGRGSRYYYGHGYYGGGYYPYYPYLSFSFGWPYYGGYWGGYGYGYPYYAPYYAPSYDGTYDSGYQSAPPPPEDNMSYGDDTAPAQRPQDSDTGRLSLDVRPPDASVYVDNEFWGNARDSQSLILRSGRHAIEVIRPGFEVARREVDVPRGQTTQLTVELRRR